MGAILLAALSLAAPVALGQAGGYAGEAACKPCHATYEKHYGETRHAKVFRLNPRTDLERRGCEACHGPAAAHTKDPANKSLIIAFTREAATPVEAQNAQCFQCHQGGQRMHWQGSAHARQKLACSDCHNPMARVVEGLLRKSSINETCLTCHGQQRTEFMKRSHMPVPEGKMSCADCHNPHGSTSPSLIKTESVNDLCYACHAEKRGPFLWEHAPARESCLNCHHPHGSNHDKLLTAARPYLCQQCHDPSVGHPPQLFRADQTAANAANGGTPSSRIIGRSCQNCHSQIHGSNHPAGTRFQR
jgi:DmsE family decaheme c-type cytochrome